MGVARGTRDIGQASNDQLKEIREGAVQVLRSERFLQGPDRAAPGARRNLSRGRPPFHLSQRRPSAPSGTGLSPGPQE